MLVGIVTILFSIQLYKDFKQNVYLKLSAVSALIAGISMILVSIFPCDPQCIDVTDVGRWHTITSIPPSIFLPTAAVLAGIGFLKLKRWGKPWGMFSIALGMGSFFSGTLMSIEFFAPIAGFIQRMGIGLVLVWIAMVSFRVIRVKNESNSASWQPV